MSLPVTIFTFIFFNYLNIHKSFNDTRDKIEERNER